MSIYSGGTFRVGPAPNFVYSNGNTVKYYPHAIDMWKAHSNMWDTVKNKFKGTGGTAEGAMKIKLGLEYLNQYNPRNNENTAMFDEEIDIVTTALGRRRLSLLRYSENDGFRKRGRDFEKVMARLVDRLTTGEGTSDTGSRSTESPLEIRVQIDLTGKNIYTKTGKVSKDLLWQYISEDVREQITKIVGGTRLNLEKVAFESNNSTTGYLIIRQVKALNKIDTDARGRTVIDFQSRVSGAVWDLAHELATHTFSLKNYKDETLKSWGGVSLGDANKFRAYSSFLYGALGQKLSFPDLCTFIYASENSKNEEVKRYLSWAKYVYELTGLGQEDWVDYLIVNNSTVGSVQVYAINELLKNMPNGQPGAAITHVSWTNWKGETIEGNKFIFKG